ncbi:DUF2806 domain-containing protein [Aminobacter sp. MET-1]|uniref:DUF2806 domain-containing protein n=1 Tax=Aminobacter sp. MET-1 TaxID=2951085 RepID=UPI00226A20EE|nr:DUF2806 domain-containing protein [Aminobacter sp. MET-1]MCX8572667.1 DUF2806 domain-containing protein [Aminobacter sp. MET-1]
MGDSNEVEEIGVSTELTPNGFSAKVKSRTASAWDRLWGSKVEKRSIPIEAENAEAKAISDGRVKMINALSEIGVERLKSDPEFAARAVENMFPSLLRRQDNKDAVLEVALEDLRQNPRSPGQDSSGSETLDDSFLNRFERYAEEATVDVLRAKWGKVLAAEIRAPGTFNAKVLRVVDELDAPTALLFERFCHHRLRDVVVKCLAGALSFEDQTRLVSSGLLVDPGLLGQQRMFAETTDNRGTPLWIMNFDIALVAILRETSIPKGELTPIASGDGVPGVPVYVLTDVGYAVSSILQDRQEMAFATYFDQLAAFLAPAEVREYRNNGNDQAELIRALKNEVSSSVSSDVSE